MSINTILDFLFPKFCLNCQKRGSYLCWQCFNYIPLLKDQNCPNCRRVNHDGKFCDGNCAADFFFDQLIVCSNYEKSGLLKKLLVLLKYKFSEEVIDILGKILKHQFAYFSHNFISDQALIVPVPLHKRRLNYRSFNQALLLANYINRNFNSFELVDLILRKKFNGTQVKNDRIGRLKNLSGNFEIKAEYKEFLSGKTVILIDDVATTCGTLNECSKILKAGGSKYVCGLVLARGRLLN